MASGATHIDIDGRDVDVPLSALGEDQARAVGRWFAAMPAFERPEIVLTSPYTRAVETAKFIEAEGGVTGASAQFIIDERLREKEFGILDRLTREGIEKLHPEQAQFRRLMGKFYHRPPAGESWCDVALRLRSALETVTAHHAGKRTLIVGHQVVVLCLRYLIEHLTEKQILAIDAEGDVANCAVTEYAFDEGQGISGRPMLLRYNFVAPVQEEGTQVTSEPSETLPAR